MAAYIDLNEKKLFFVLPDFVQVPDFVQTQTIFSTHPLETINIDFIEITNFCKDSFFRTLSLKASETLGKFYFNLKLI